LKRDQKEKYIIKVIVEENDTKKENNQKTICTTEAQKR
jgi:hypothetical protein